MSLAGFIWSFVRKQRLRFAVIFILALIWTLDTLIWPFFLRKIVDVLSLYETDRLSVKASLNIVLVWGGSFWIFIEGGCRFRDFLAARAYPKLEADIRMTLFDHVQHHSPKYFNEHFSGSLSNKIGDMVLTTSSILRDISITFIPSFLTCILTVVVFAQMNAFLALTVGVWLLVHFIFCWFFTLKCAKYAFLHGESRSVLAGKIVDSLTNNFIVNTFFRFRFEKNHIAHYQKNEKKANQLAQSYTVKMFCFLSAAYVIEIFTLTWFMIFYWMQGKISTGEVVQLFYTLWNLSMVIWVVTSLAPEFFQALGIAKQALTVMQDPQDILDPPHAIDLSVKQGEIVFDNVSFGYGNKKIFQNKNIHIKAGEKIGLVGYSGAGKSTFVNLILRFFSVESGKILIDGQDIAHVTLESLRSNVALIPQDPILFHRSLEDNILYGKVDASQEEVIKAAKLAHCHEFIQKCPEGYATLVGERGTKLSGGEKQRIAIARAMLLKAPILILDEATSALDSVTEKYIQDSLEELMKNRTTLVVAHRLSTLSKMDRILVFDQGSIIEQGSPLELLNKKGHYANMWQMQAGGFLPDQPA
ncbi:MAG: ABC transporter ATP-binding protein/permease [Rhabdochlamydiaceae bacterium]|nr:ABC transporter ATP-binding protein/permease [Rhabdochlamydiaceae bacterium]